MSLTKRVLDYVFAEDIRRDIEEARQRCIEYVGVGEKVFRQHFPKKTEILGMFDSSWLPNILTLGSIASLAYSLSRSDYVGGLILSLALGLVSEKGVRAVCRESLIHKIDEASSNISRIYGTYHLNSLEV